MGSELVMRTYLTVYRGSVEPREPFLAKHRTPWFPSTVRDAADRASDRVLRTGPFMKEALGYTAIEPCLELSITCELLNDEGRH
jgi:hypothetical protein